MDRGIRCGIKCARFWRPLAVLTVLLASFACFVQPVQALEVPLGGKTLMVDGYLKQSVAYGVSGNHYDTEDQFQQFLMQALLELKYEARPDLSFFTSLKANVDWAYPIYDDEREWQQKGFDKSYDKRFILGDWQDVLGEAHVTYAAGDFFLRVGKQIVVWGETDGFRLMDQINPLDTRRGITDVEFEYTVMPVWLLRLEYRQPVVPSWLQELSYQFVFNPNVKFQGNEPSGPAKGPEGNGIWCPTLQGPNMTFITIPGVGYVPTEAVGFLGLQDFADGTVGSVVGSFDPLDLQKPGDWDPKGFKYAGRITAMIQDARITLNGLYGRDNDYVFAQKPGVPPRIEVSPWDGRAIIHPSMVAYYPYFKFVGATLSKDLNGLQANILGGVAPVLRLEALYAFNTTFVSVLPGPVPTTTMNTFEDHDELRWAAGLDWKVRIPALNEKSYFMISPQVYNRRIMDYPDHYSLYSGSEPFSHEDTWITTVFMNTSYLHNKLLPSFFWLRDWTTRGGFIKPELAYAPDDTWKYALGAILIHGDAINQGFWCLKNKSQVYFTLSYRF